jgi:hypothetical protein
VGTTFNLPVTSGQLVRLQLDDLSFPNTWFSGTAGYPSPGKAGS